MVSSVGFVNGMFVDWVRERRVRIVSWLEFYGL